MAIATNVSIGTGRKVSVNFQSEELTLTVSYELERQDTDLIELVKDKAVEVEKAHSLIWRRIREVRAEDKDKSEAPPSTAVSSEPSETEKSRSEMSDSSVPVSSTYNGNGAKSHEAPLEVMITDPQRRAVYALSARAEMTSEELKRRLQMRFGKSKVEDLTKRQASMLLTELQRTEREKVHTSAS